MACTPHNVCLGLVTKLYFVTQVEAKLYFAPPAGCADSGDDSGLCEIEFRAQVRSQGQLGNEVQRRAYCFIRSRLQWGRRFSSAEISFWGASPINSFLLQWGRRFSSAEISIVLCSDWNIYLASMGPPIFIGGNLEKRGVPIAPVPSFNGAADFHRRK